MIKTLTGFSGQPLTKQGDVADCPRAKRQVRQKPVLAQANQPRNAVRRTGPPLADDKAKLFHTSKPDYTVKDLPAIWLNSSGCSQGFSSGQDMMGFQPQNIFVTI